MDVAGYEAAEPDPPDDWDELPPEAYEENLGLSPEDYAALFPEPETKRAEDEAATAAYRAGTLESDDGMPDFGLAVALASGDLEAKSDAGVVGAIRACAELMAMAKSRMYESLGEFAERRPGRAWDRRAEEAELEREGPDGPDETPGPGTLPRVPSREMTQEVMLAMNWTEYRAAGETHRAVDLLRRLPLTLALLKEGRTDDEHVKLACEFTAGLSDVKARMMDARIAPWMEGRTTGQLKDKLSRELIRIDPAAAEERRKRGEKQARVSSYPNPDGTGTFAIEQAPADEVAAARSRVNAIARAVKSSGSDDPVALLEAKTALGLLLGTLPYVPPSAGGNGDGNGDEGGSDGGSGGGPGRDDGAPAGTAPDGRAPDEPEHAAPPAAGGGGDWENWPGIPPASDAAAPGCAVLPPGLRPAKPGRIKLLSPWRTLAGTGTEPGELSWFGIITPGQSLELAAAAAADPGTRWQVIVTDGSGRPLAVDILRRRRPGRRARGQPRAPGLVEEVTLTIPAPLARRLARDHALHDRLTRKVGHEPLADVLASAVTVADRAAAEAEHRARRDAAAGGCAHTMGTGGYRIPGRLRRWVIVRDRTCQNPVCRRPAARCDLDHTVPWDKGGRTCDCDLRCECRTHHQLKQLPGWRLACDRDGALTWTTPAGLTYRKEPYLYPV